MEPNSPVTPNVIVEEDDYAGWVNEVASSPFIKATETPVHHRSINPKARLLWTEAAHKIKDAGTEAFADFDVDGIAAERAIRHTFHPHSNTWKKNMVLIKMEPTPFASGALRNAYRMKKMSNWKPSTWRQASNFVAKNMKKEELNADRARYFSEVRQQMLAKYWAEKYNQLNPPKKVDFIMTFLIELIDRPGSPIFSVERYIEGHYEKYNNNCGFVSEDQRNTPHAFSHFTYESSKRQLMVVDIQGVQDLYTDPQIHSVNLEFGNADLGIHGFALFFATHRCNSICKALGLTALSRSPFPDGTVNGTSGGGESVPQTPHHVKFTAAPKDSSNTDDSKKSDTVTTMSSLQANTDASSSADFGKTMLRLHTHAIVRRLTIDTSNDHTPRHIDCLVHFDLYKLFQVGNQSVPVDLEQSMAHLKIAAQSGFILAQRILSETLADPTGINDQSGAFYWARKAGRARTGFPECMKDVAERYMHGNGCEKNYKRAIHWMKRAIKSNHMVCQALCQEKCEPVDEAVAYYQIGLMYETGDGNELEADPMKALAYYQKAVDESGGMHIQATKKMAKLSMMYGESEEPLSADEDGAGMSLDDDETPASFDADMCMLKMMRQQQNDDDVKQNAEEQETPVNRQADLTGCLLKRIESMNMNDDAIDLSPSIPTPRRFDC